MTAVTYRNAMRRCAKCDTVQPNSVKGWSRHPLYHMICPTCTTAKLEKLAQKKTPA